MVYCVYQPVRGRKRGGFPVSPARKEHTAEVFVRYRCLVLDHDDTVTDSTAKVHYPAFLKALEEQRPGVTMSLNEYFLFNFDPGFLEFCTDVLHMSDEEMEREYEIWDAYVKEHIPEVFPGMKRVIERQLEAGGHVCVISHSMADNIRRDYRAAGLPEPEIVFGWEQAPEHRKPSPWPLREIMKRLGLENKDLLMVDDLKPGYDMAKEAGVDFAAALWAYDVKEIHGFMRSSCEKCFSTPEELEKWLFDEE